MKLFGLSAILSTYKRIALLILAGVGLLIVVRLLTACSFPVPIGGVNIVAYAVTNTPRPTATATSTPTVTPSPMPTATYTPAPTMTPSYPRVSWKRVSLQENVNGVATVSVVRSVCATLATVWVEMPNTFERYEDRDMRDLCLRTFGVQAG